MKDFEKVYLDTASRKVVLINRISDPSMWVIYVYKKILFLKKKIESYWFTNQKDAEIFALEYVKSNG